MTMCKRERVVRMVRTLDDDGIAVISMVVDALVRERRRLVRRSLRESVALSNS